MCGLSAKIRDLKNIFLSEIINKQYEKFDEAIFAENDSL